MADEQSRAAPAQPAQPGGASAAIAAVQQASRAASARVLAGRRPPELRRASQEVSERYRTGQAVGASGELGPDGAAAYLATRAPATLAAVAAVLAEVRSLRPEFAPETLLDLGAGTGAATWAAAALWPSLRTATLVEPSGPLAAIGRALADEAPYPLVAGASWEAGDVAELDGVRGDLVVASYVLGELPDEAVGRALERWAAAATGLLIVVEPGTPAGFERLRAARRRLIDLGGHVVAPCPHDGECPMTGGDWCHFAARLDRSALHRGAKDAERGFEDEKYCYVAMLPSAAQAGPGPASRRPSRLLRAPRPRGGHVRLVVCGPDGLGERVVTKSDRDLYRWARSARWGDHLPPGPGDGPS